MLIKYLELINEFHLSKKKIPCVKINDDNTIVSTIINGVKFELFFNSIFKFADSDGLLLYEVNREDEFAPIKNPEESANDNPRTARQMMTNLFKGWYLNSGGEIVNEPHEDFILEIEQNYRQNLLQH